MLSSPWLHLWWASVHGWGYWARIPHAKWVSGFKVSTHWGCIYSAHIGPLVLFLDVMTCPKERKAMFGAKEETKA